MKWKAWKLQNKVAATFMLVFLITVIVLGNVAYILMARDNEKRTIELMDTAIAQISETIDVHIMDIQRVSQAIFSDPIIQRNLRLSREEAESFQVANEMRYQLYQYTFPWSYIHGAYLYGMDDRLFYYSKGSSPLIGFTIRQEPWYGIVNSEQEPGVFYWPTGPEATSIHEPELVFSLIRAINDVNIGTRLGYLKLDLDIHLFKSIFDKNVRDLPLRYILIKDQDVMYDNEGLLTGKRLGAERLENMSRDQGRLTIQGTKHVFVTHQSTFTGWRVAAFIPYDYVVQQSVKIRNTLILIGLGSLLVVGMASYYLTSGILQPLTRMMTTMKKVEAGDLTVRLVNTAAHDEIGKLSSLFNMMLDSINELIDRVYRSELREKEAQLQALQSQINPHLLFNTLNTIKALSRKKGVEDAAEMAESLAEIFRYTMQDWQQTVVLSEELHHIQSYMQIQRIRFGKRIQYVDLVDELLYDAEIIRLSIQPLVENAVIHGLENQLENGTVEISARVIPRELSPPLLEIRVTDTGQGMTMEEAAMFNRFLQQESDTLKTMPGSKSGIALLNVQKRIELLYGKSYGLHLEPGEDSGVCVSMTIPYKKRGEQR